MHFKKTLIHTIAVVIAGLAATTASATPITGNWTGNWSGSGITATFTMNVGAEDSFGRFTGYFDWTCTSGIACSGTENFAGGTSGTDSFTFWTTSFVNPYNLGSSIYWGSIVNDGDMLIGFDQGPSDKWSATRVSSSSVPEPGTLVLMSLGLLGMGLTMRRKLPAAPIS